MKKQVCFLLILSAVLTLSAQDPLMTGLDAYARSDWSTAILSFRKAASEPGAGAEPWYWLIMAELSAEEYSRALADIERFNISFPADARIPDTRYQKGRVQFLLRQYDDSIKTLYQFISTWPSHPMISSAYYWIGESLYAVGRFDEARNIFLVVTDSYPQAVKREASLYRISLIDQKDKEEELLKLLKMSHEESLRVIEDYQRREKTYEQAITAYQKRISDMIKDTRLGELEKQLADEKGRTALLQDKISTLEIQNAELVSSLARTGTHVPATATTPDVSQNINSPDPDKRRLALEALRNKAQALQHVYDELLTGGNQ
ncbi:tetratricopeptide repeat protein [Brucepastera parasyntrophica]|uniref:tetratricopeptide repeat protein n=1 Tax=Brucepastera parasyntrophica TaxID=2880008 RepID=UPI00210A3C01|nr:tetratricopeptide repeat protein [Brucepastera parasyntrophica]ULQ59896.1 tetratricopeptide repeat protein [Brucepastera parasyntrophica]